MKNKLLLIITAVTLFTFPKINYGQVINLGTAADFVLFTSGGAVGNTGISQVTGNVGTNSGAITGFGNVNGVMHNGDGATANCMADLTIAYNQLNATIPTFFPANLLGNGQILNAGVYSIAAATTLNLTLTLDGQGNPNAVFIFKIGAPFAANTNAKVRLVNGAKACNVFWKVEGAVNLAAGVAMKGTIVANNAAINMMAGDTLEGRALSTTGQVTIDNVLAYTPIGCGSPVLNGPIAPTLGAVDCFALFTSNGPATNNLAVTNVIGDIGSDLGTTTGFGTPNIVIGTIHAVPDGTTAACAADLLNVYNYLNTLPIDIELLYPAQFGNRLVLTPHTYLMNAAATFVDTLYLNALGNPNAVFVININNGGLTTGTYAKVNLINGAQAKNVFWKVQGAISIADFSNFKGTFVSFNGAINLAKGVVIDGRALTTNGALNTASVNVTIPAGSCGSVPPPTIVTQPTPEIVCEGDSVSFSVVAIQTGLTYQWRKGIVNLVNGGNISGAQTATLTINPATLSDAAANYNVVVSSGTAPSATSTNVALIVNTSPSITAEPADQTACPGASVSFSVSATGSNLTYQWKKGLVNLINGVNISGATTATLTINPVTLADTSSFYHVVISGACPPNDTSINVSLTIGGSTITIQPTNKSACVGNSVSFPVVASGSGLSYQWRKGNVNLTNVGNISGATSATLVINPVGVSDVATNYNVFVTGACLPSDTSVNVSLTVNATPVASPSSNSPVCVGSAINLTAQTVTGASYSWAGPNTYTSSIQNPTIAVSSLTNNGTYSLTVTSNSCSSLTSTVGVVVNVCSSDLSIVKTVNNTTPIFGNQIVFTITATNNGPTNATGVEVNDVLQSGYLYVSSSSTTGTFDPLTGVWTIGNINNGSTEVLTITVTVIANGNYVNTAIISGNEPDLNMSNNVSTIETFPSDFFIPEGFSPNDDGINDLFVIRGILNFPNNKFSIFNRWGNVVFEASPYKNTWDGKATKGIRVGGDELPVGTYFYILDLGDGSPVFKGTIYLNK